MVIQITYTGQFFLVFVYLGPITWFLFPHLPCPRTLPNRRAPLCAKMDSSAEAGGRVSTLSMGWVPLPFDLKGAFLHMCRKGGFLDLRSGHLSLYSSRAQLLPITSSLECLGENKASVLLCLANTSCPAQGPIHLLPHCNPDSEGNSSMRICISIQAVPQ